jgi:23S rRNA (cytosine1962-C5)-methyltransferase
MNNSNNIDNKTDYQAQLFANRLKKKYKELRKWARKNRISSYRLYDRDIPEIPVSLDLYEFLPDGVETPLETARFISSQNDKLSANEPGIENEIKERLYAVLYLYERPYEKSEEEENKWLQAMSLSAANTLGISEEHIITKSRGHKNHSNSEEENDVQYEKNNTINEISGYTQEQGQIFKLNLTNYLDTGLFFDHRPLRSVIRETSAKKRVLNLFCYTGSFSVYAAQGNAAYVESVDLSNTYLNWTKDNMKLNGFTEKNKYIFTKSDCIYFLQEKAVAQKALLSNPNDKEAKSKAATYDLIILDPPTFSNSKKTNNVLDINKQWPQLVKDCLNILNPGGTLYFSTNSERLKFDAGQLPPKTISNKTFTVEDITSQTIPNDYAGSKPHRCWKFTLEN